MYRPAARAALRSSQCSLAPARTVASRRFITTEPPHLRSRSWKSSALRWGLAIAGIYYYNTSPVFGEYPENNLLNPNVDALEDETSSSTLDALTASSRRKKDRDASVLQSAVEHASATAASENPAGASSSQLESTMAIPVDGAADLEEEAESEGAFNPVTGEINWDCPCLGGMAYGPCGNEFREAFSCFVYSKEEPKGMDCIEKFQTMQTCFRAHPETYKGELEDDDELDESLAQEKEELQKEIAERRAAVEAQEKDNIPQGRLLEEPGSAPAPTPKKTQSTSKSDSASKNGNAKSSPKDNGEPAPRAEQVRPVTS